MEAGISHEMEQFDRNFKLRQIMGNDAAKYGASMKKGVSMAKMK